MYTEAGPLRTLLAMARSALPEQAFLKRDRGDMLFVSNAPTFAPELTVVPGFSCERRGDLIYLLPEASWVVRWEGCLPEAPDQLCGSLLRFRGTTPNRDNIQLFARGAKLLDGRPSPGEIEIFDRDIRRRAALALRGGCGGALYGCAMLLHRMREKAGLA